MLQLSGNGFNDFVTETNYFALNPASWKNNKFLNYFSKYEINHFLSAELDLNLQYNNEIILSPPSSFMTKDEVEAWLGSYTNESYVAETMQLKYYFIQAINEQGGISSFITNNYSDFIDDRNEKYNILDNMQNDFRFTSGCVNGRFIMYNTGTDCRLRGNDQHVNPLLGYTTLYGKIDDEGKPSCLSGIEAKNCNHSNRIYVNYMSSKETSSYWPDIGYRKWSHVQSVYPFKFSRDSGYYVKSPEHTIWGGNDVQSVASFPIMSVIQKCHANKKFYTPYYNSYPKQFFKMTNSSDSYSFYWHIHDQHIGCSCSGNILNWNDFTVSNANERGYKFREKENVVLENYFDNFKIDMSYPYNYGGYLAEYVNYFCYFWNDFTSKIFEDIEYKVCSYYTNTNQHPRNAIYLDNAIHCNFEHYIRKYNVDLVCGYPMYAKINGVQSKVTLIILGSENIKKLPIFRDFDYFFYRIFNEYGYAAVFDHGQCIYTLMDPDVNNDSHYPAIIP